MRPKQSRLELLRRHRWSWMRSPRALLWAHVVRSCRGSSASLRGVQLAQARLELARLFLADGLAAEALAVLDAGAEADRADSDGLLRGAAEVLLGRPQRALELLGSAGSNAEHAVWQAAARADEEDWPAAAERLHHAGDVWARYRPPLRLALGLRVVRCADPDRTGPGGTEGSGATGKAAARRAGSRSGRPGQGHGAGGIAQHGPGGRSRVRGGRSQW